MKGTLIILPVTLAILSAETWVDLQIRHQNSVSVANTESTGNNHIESWIESIILEFMRPEVLPSLVVMAGCLVYAHRNSQKFVTLMDNFSLLGGVFLFPIFVLVLAGYSFIDRLLVFSGSGSAIAWFRTYLELTFESEFIKDTVSLAVHLLMFLPLVLFLAVLIYGNQTEKD